jgi:hypothetical protein
MNLDLNTVKEYAPVAGRYVATAIVGAAVAAAAKYNIGLDPATQTALITGLTGAFVALVTFAFRNKAADKKAMVDSTVSAAITGVVPAPIAAKMSIEQAQAVDAAPNAKVG